MARKFLYQTMYERQKYDQNAFSFSIAIFIFLYIPTFFDWTLTYSTLV